MAYDSIINEIVSKYNRYRYVLNGEKLLTTQRKRYNYVMEKAAVPLDQAVALKFLSECLEQYHKQKVIILIDEYDVPLEKAYFRRFYDRMADFIRFLFESVLY